MRVSGHRTGLIDALIELLGIKSGLAISQEACYQQLATVETADRWWEGDPLGAVRIRAEELEAVFCHLLYRVGATDTAKTPMELVIEFARSNTDLEEHLALEDFAPSEGIGFMMKSVALTSAITSLASGLALGDTHPDQTPLLEALERKGDWERLRSDFEQRYLLARSMPAVRTWDGRRPLNELFDGDNSTPQTEGPYFDQRFIDYLAHNARDLERISWRQFEHLVAEFFSRSGYEVHLGTGTKDGGVDVKATRTDLLGPELIVVQCRRQGSQRPVGVEAVRAFWSVVQDNTATRGMVATTSRLTRGAKTYCEARQHRLSAAEAANVTKWIASMASNVA